MEQMHALIARQQGQLDQLQHQLQRQQAQQAQARQASPVGQDLSELRSIVDTRVMEKTPIIDGNEAHFAEWRFTLCSGSSWAPNSRPDLWSQPPSKGPYRKIPNEQTNGRCLPCVSLGLDIQLRVSDTALVPELCSAHGVPARPLKGRTSSGC